MNDNGINITYEELDDFLGGRLLPDSLRNRLIHLEKNIEEVVYRGLPFPKQLLKAGCIIEEWNGSSHWSIDKNVALDFSIDYMNEEYVEELEKKLNKKIEMIRLVLYCEDIKGIETYNILNSINENNVFFREKEVSVIGYDFIVEEIYVENGIYYAKVKPIKNKYRE